MSIMCNYKHSHSPNISLSKLYILYSFNNLFYSPLKLMVEQTRWQESNAKVLGYRKTSYIEKEQYVI